MLPFFLGTTSTPPTAAIGGVVISLAVLVYLLYRQRQVRPLQSRLLFPLVLGVIGLVGLLSDTKTHPLSSVQVVVLVALMLVDAIGLGAVRAFTVRLWRDGDRLLRQGSWLTVGLWLVGVAVHEGTLAVAHIDSSSLLLYMGLTLGVQRIVLEGRGRRVSLDSGQR